MNRRNQAHRHELDSRPYSTLLVAGLALASILAGLALGWMTAGWVVVPK